MLYIYEVHLNHDSSKFSNDALNLRYNQVKNSYIKAPEWIKGQKPHPAAYALNKVKGGKVTIKARFAGGPGYKSLKIRAVDYFKKPEETLSIWENIGRGVLRITAKNLTYGPIIGGQGKVKHIGRFASDYRKLFGELPSETKRGI